MFLYLNLIYQNLIGKIFRLNHPLYLINVWEIFLLPVLMVKKLFVSRTPFFVKPQLPKKLLDAKIQYGADYNKLNYLLDQLDKNIKKNSSTFPNKQPNFSKPIIKPKPRHLEPRYSHSIFGASNANNEKVNF